MKILLIIAAFWGVGVGEEVWGSSVRDVCQLRASEIKHQVKFTAAHLTSGLCHPYSFVVHYCTRTSIFTDYNL